MSGVIADIMMDNVTGSQFEVFLVDAAASDALGTALANALPDRGQTGAVLHFHGELGAGKTTCARSLLRTLGVAGLIRSPTYTLVETYALPELTCVHVDLYRLHGPAEVEELDLRTHLGTPGLILVEWPERGGAAVPPPDLEVTLEYADDSRRATLASHSEVGHKWLQNLVEDTSLVAYVPNLT
jgi:tRNA threonylcarbamoyladenosine biosynthesis protein TsaE